MSSSFSPHNPSFLECWLLSTSSISLHLYKYRLVCLTLPLRASLLPPLSPLVCPPVAALLSCFWDFFLPAKTSKTMAHWLEQGRVGMCQNLEVFFFSLFEPAVGCLQDDLSILLFFFFSWGTPHTLCGSITLSCLSVYPSKGNIVCSFGVCLWARLIFTVCALGL